MLTILQAETGKNFELARNIFKEYAASLDFDLDFQDFEEEPFLASMPHQRVACWLPCMEIDLPDALD